MRHEQGPDTMMLAMAMTGLVVLQQAAAPAGPTFILGCEVAGKDGRPATVRTFRLGRYVFQEWKPGEREFGPNLCQSYACTADRKTLEGFISTASMTLTIRLDPPARQATWRTTGASGLDVTSGPCTIQREPAGGYKG
ncbi:hypothetical protein [Phenylobacterium sp. J367]|uniref:hypothetical protein n=1 Tax=Phenylobacterium sp. J367 TaxID=2898435 RepID=UPI0021513F08|nr:hypothetical protein [Phenylobacterium sp. J367]MCR5878827.1 hypothetical protein [Phenylobacterium sp. J367]